MEGAAARDAGWPNAGQSDLHEGEAGTIGFPLAERLEYVIRTRASGLIADVTATRSERARDQRPQHAFDWLLVAVLSMTAGSVDLIGFLAFGGLFIAHITGNIVILAAHYITGGFSRIGPLIAVPVFIVVLGTVVWLFEDKPKHQTLRALLILHAALLTGLFAVSTAFGPFANPGGALAASVGMLGVAAMATQNALVKLDLPGFPTTAVLTTNTVQLTIEFTTLLRGNTLPEQMALARRRIRMTLPLRVVRRAGCSKCTSDCGLWHFRLCWPYLQYR